MKIEKKGTPFQGKPKTKFKMLVLNPDRKSLYESLDLRVNEMLTRGALEEAKQIFKLVKDGSINKSQSGLKAIGLKHLLEHLEGAKSIEGTLRLWKRDTRRLAKRQMTWLRKFCPPSEDCIWMDPHKISAARSQELLFC